MPRRTLIVASVVPLALYLASGLTVVQPDELAVVRRCGAVLAAPWEPGLHWGLPWGLDRIDRLKINLTRTLTVGAASNTAAPLLRAPDPATDDFLTGDLNVVVAEALVQYRVREPVQFLYGAADVEASLAALSEGVLARSLANRGIDELVTTGCAILADAVARSIQSLADQEKLGISLVAVRLGRLVPPMAVAPAFADAARGRSDRRQMITRAEEFRDRARSETAGRAREIADAAAGRFDRLVQPARGEAQRFARVLAEARKDPLAFRRRLFLETIAEVLPRFRRTVVIAPGQDLDISLLGDEPPSTDKMEAPR